MNKKNLFRFQKKIDCFLSYFFIFFSSSNMQFTFIKYTYEKYLDAYYENARLFHGNHELRG